MPAGSVYAVFEAFWRRHDEEASETSAYSSNLSFVTRAGNDMKVHLPHSRVSPDSLLTVESLSIFL